MSDERVSGGRAGRTTWWCRRHPLADGDVGGRDVDLTAAGQHPHAGRANDEQIAEDIAVAALSQAAPHHDAAAHRPVRPRRLWTCVVFGGHVGDTRRAHRGVPPFSWRDHS